MPGTALVAHKTRSSICNCGYSRSADQMCCQDCFPDLSEEEEVAAEKSLSTYCHRVEFYDMIRRRANINPSFLQRCLRYKIQEKNKRRVQMSVSVTRSLINGVHFKSLPLMCIMLARPVADFGATEDFSAVYRFTRSVILNNSIGAKGMKHTRAKFILPDLNKLEGEIRSGSLCILFVSFALSGESISAIDLTKHCTDVSYVQANNEGYCHFGRVPLEVLYLSWEKSPNLSFGERAEMMSTIEMHSSFMKLSCTDEDKYISFQNPDSSGRAPVPQQVEIIISAEEVGTKDKSPYDSYMLNNIPSSLLSHIIRLRSGNVVFNHMYYHDKFHITEVTEDFCCPFCLVRCTSFKGLKYHLSSSHDLLNFEFWVSNESPAVNISVQNDVSLYKVVAVNIDPQKQTFYFCSKPMRRRKAKYVQQCSNDYSSAAVNEARNRAAGIAEPMDHDIPSPDATGNSTAMAYSHSYADPECIQSRVGSNLGTPAMLHMTKTKKLSIEPSHPKNLALLQKREFFHSQSAQPMVREQVLSDRDSEDEVDDEVADFEDRKRLDEFVDVTKDEKQMMHMWNSFMRKQRVLADGHIGWACEAFSKLHGPNLVQVPSLLWCWKLFMIKLWNHGLLDARGMNNCNLILEQFQNQHGEDPKNLD